MEAIANKSAKIFLGLAPDLGKLKLTFEGRGQSSRRRVMFAGPSGSSIGITSTID